MRKIFNPEIINELKDKISNLGEIELSDYIFDFCKLHSVVLISLDRNWVDKWRRKIIEYNNFDIIYKPKLSDLEFIEYCKKTYKNQNLLYWERNFHNSHIILC